MPMILVGAACSGADSGPVFTADEVPSATPTPTSQIVVPLTTLSPALTPTPTIVFERLSSLEGGVAEVAGIGATSTDLVTVDGAQTTFLSFETGPEGRFVAQVTILGEGTHTICIADACEVLARE